MLVFYCLLVQCANPFHSNPALPESDPWAFDGDLEVCKVSVFHLAREVLFSAGFATLRPFNTRQHVGNYLNILSMCAESPAVHTSNISSCKKKLFQFSCVCEQLH